MTPEDKKQLPLNCDRDAARWAREFNAVVQQEGGKPMDEGWLIGWFANAMMCGEDTYRWRKEAEARETPSAIATSVPAGELPAYIEAVCGPDHLVKIDDGKNVHVRTAGEWMELARRDLSARSSELPHDWNCRLDGKHGSQEVWECACGDQVYGNPHKCSRKPQTPSYEAIMAEGESWREECPTQAVRPTTAPISLRDATLEELEAAVAGEHRPAALHEALGVLYARLHEKMSPAERNELLEAITILKGDPSAPSTDRLVEACRGLISYWTRNLRNFQWEKADTHVKRINAALPETPSATRGSDG